MIAQKLKYYRAIQRLSQKDLADCCGWTVGSIGTIEARESNVTIATALKIARALDVKIEDLVGDLSRAQREEMRAAIHSARQARSERQRVMQRRRERRYRDRLKQKSVNN